MKTDLQNHPSELPANRLGLEDCRVIGLLNGLEQFGQEKANIEVFKALRSRGAEIQVGVNAIENGGQVGELVRELGFSCFTLPFGCQWSKTFFRKQPSLILKCAGNVLTCSRILRQKIQSFRPTHLHLGNPLVYSYVYGALKASRVPLIYRMGDQPPRDSKPNMMIWKSCFRRASRVVANSRSVRDIVVQTLRNSESKLRLIYNMAPGESGNISWLDAASKKSGPAGRDDPVFRVLFVGQFSIHKGIQHVVDAAIQLLSQGPNIRFEIVGGSKYYAELQNSIRNQVNTAGLESQIIIRGHVNDPLPHYVDADLLIVPSLIEESAANVVLEAKRVGVPSVVYPSGGLPELVIHRKNGYVCREKSVEALVEGIQWFMEDRQRMSDARQSAMHDYQNRFGADRFAARWADVYGGAELAWARPEQPMFDAGLNQRKTECT